ncbi:MAG: Rieske 2Fe-2S domain-containing protein [Deltaproteobacteria bacterium]|nr:Rieske 2Fe-2S domain-containing protein [Deltaproteobacteria bacterium]
MVTHRTLPLVGALHAPDAPWPAVPLRKLGGRPVKVELAGVPFAVWRDAKGALGAVLDRCPHRFAPLSAGRIRPDGRLACGYHGWHFDARGQGVSPSQPGLTGCSVPSVMAFERFGWVWLAARDAPPGGELFDTEPLPFVTSWEAWVPRRLSAVLATLDQCPALDLLRARLGWDRSAAAGVRCAREASPEGFVERWEGTLDRALAWPARVPEGTSFRYERSFREVPLRATLRLSWPGRPEVVRAELFPVPEGPSSTRVVVFLFAKVASAALPWALRGRIPALLGAFTADPGQRRLTPSADDEPAFAVRFPALVQSRAALRALAARVPTGVDQTPKPWTGYKTFEVVERREETATMVTLRLRPRDGSALPSYLPGQHVTVRVTLPDGARAVRCYSLSRAPSEDGYQLTVQRTTRDGRPGLVSCYLHDHAREGTTAELRSPSGRFVLAPGALPVALVAGGVGLTPLLAMAQGLANTGAQRPCTLLLGFHSLSQVPFRETLEALCRAHRWLRVVLCLSDGALPEDSPFTCVAGRITPDVLLAHVPAEAEFHLCGPAAMLAALTPALLDRGIPPERLHSEAFGPASVVALRAGAPPAATVTFARSGLQVPWDGHTSSLVELARNHGITIPTGCCVGSCTTCMTKVLAGSVEYRQAPGEAVPEGQCLVCIAVPRGDLTLDW